VSVGAGQHRVRVIKRVRKPVRVSFVSEDDLRAQHIDIPRRRFTLVIAVLLCGVLVGGGYFLLKTQFDAAIYSLTQAQAQLSDVQTQITEKQKAWSQFQNLEPRLKTLSNLLERHTSPDHVLRLIEETTLPTVVYTSFSLTSDRTVSMSVVADSLESAAQQTVVLQNAPFVQKATIGGYSIQYGSDPTVPKAVTFQASLILREEAIRAETPQVAAEQ
jgi:Tfp pilus assembly protein PilN